MRDPAAEAVVTRRVPLERSEQQLTEHDRSAAFDFRRPAPINSALKNQPHQGRILGFDFSDPLGAPKPFTTLQEVMQQEIAARPKVMAAQRKLLEERYNLTPKLDPEAKMSRGKPLPVGPTARLPEGLTWDQLAELTPEEIRKRGVFPYPSLPHPKHANGGQVFPKLQIEMFPRLERFDVDFDLPDAFLPEFPAGHLPQNRPELGTFPAARSCHINNYYRLFKDILTPVQLDGLRMLAHPVPAGGVQSHRRSQVAAAEPRRGLPRLPRQRPHDRPVPPEPGHPPAAAAFPARHHQPARPVQSADPRLQAQPAVGRGLHRVRAADRLLQRRPDPRHEEGFGILDRVQFRHMAQMQNMFDFPPAPKLDRTRQARPAQATEERTARARSSSSARPSAACATRRRSSWITQMHDLQARAVRRRAGRLGPSRRSRCAASRTARPICTMAAA